MTLPFINGTADASGATTAALKATPELQRYTDNAFIGAWLYITSGTEDGNDFHITDSAQSAGTVTVIPTVAAAGDFDGETFEILPFSATAMHQAIDQALLALYDMGLLVRPMWVPAVTNSPIYNSSFEYWTSSSALHGWTVTGSTLARRQAVADKWVGENTLRLSAANGSLSLDTVWRRFLSDLVIGSAQLTLRAWVRSGTASDARVSLVEADATDNRTPYHAGDSDWELLSKTGIDMAATDTDWYVKLERDASNADFSEVWVEGGAYVPEHPFPLPLMPHGPDYVMLSPMDVDEDNKKARIRPSRGGKRWNDWDWRVYHDETQDVEYGVLSWTRMPPPGQRMWVVASAPLSLPTTDAGVVEVSQMEALLIAKLAALNLVRGALAGQSVAARRNWMELERRLANDVTNLSEGKGDRGDVAWLGRAW